MTTENLRREARVDARVPVVMFRGKTALRLETSDVSFKGLFVLTAEPPPLRSLVRLKVALFDREFEAHAMVVHVASAQSQGDATDTNSGGVGLQFWGLSGPDRNAWDDFVRGLVQIRRSAAKQRAAQMIDTGTHPALTEPSTPSGVRAVVVPPKSASSK